MKFVHSLIVSSIINFIHILYFNPEPEIFGLSFILLLFNTSKQPNLNIVQRLPKGHLIIDRTAFNLCATLSHSVVNQGITGILHLEYLGSSLRNCISLFCFAFQTSFSKAKQSQFSIRISDFSTRKEIFFLTVFSEWSTICHSLQRVQNKMIFSTIIQAFSLF